jgi:type VI secretion system secreted protein Hcp
METRSDSQGRWNAVLVIALTLFMLTAWMVVTDRSEASSAPTLAPVQSSDALAGNLLFQLDGSSGCCIFAKYDGVDGESQDANHDKWIDVLAMSWAIDRDTGPATGQSRRRGAAIIDDLVLTYEYDKSTPKLVEKLLKGEVIPKLEIEFTATYGGARETYLKYELKNVLLTGYGFNSTGGIPTVAIGNNFEEIKVTYTEYDEEGNSKGNVEYEWKVEKGE